MQITKTNCSTGNVYKNNFVNFKSTQKELVSPKVMNMMKNNIRELFCFQELNSVNKYVVPHVQQ